MTNAFETGQTVYDRYGSKFEFGEPLPNGRALVNPVIFWSGWDGEGSEELSYQPRIVEVSGLSADPPRDVVDEEIAAKRAELEALEQEVYSKHRDLADTQKAERERIATLERHEKLTLLSRFIAGEITHLVKIDYRIRIEELASQKCQHDQKRIKLLTLYGDTNGDLNWRLSSYSDGSGGSETVIPCLSYEQALGEAQRQIEHKVSDWEAGDKKNAHWLGYAVEAADLYGLTVADETRTAWLAYKIAEAEQRAAKAQAEADKARAEADALANRAPVNA